MDGTESTRVETVMHPQLIEAYGRMPSTREMKVLLKQVDEKYKKNTTSTTKLEQQILLDVKNLCGKLIKIVLYMEKRKNWLQRLLGKFVSACGGIGHMKTNRNCPLYGKEEELASKTVGEICQPPVSRISDILDEEGCSLPSGELIEVDGTRLKISKKLYKHAEKERKNALRLHIPRKILESGGGGIVSKKFGKKAARLSSSSSLTRAIPPGISKQELLASIPSTSNFVPLNEDIQLVSSRKPHPLTINVPSIPPNSSTSIGPLSAISSASSTGGGGGPFSTGKRRGTLDDADYLVGPQKSVQRRRADPRVSMASLLMEILNELKGFEGSEHFYYSFIF
uniref:Zinc knuckle domain-containing protein n=1 Tax=Meloidogyne incognita TaxID=6306 RepID=A0A914LK78_MELIC